MNTMGANIELLLSKPAGHEDDWLGLLDLQDWNVDLSQKIYDKPMVYYILFHFLLLGIRDIYIRTTKENEEFLSQRLFEDLGFTFTFDFLSLPKSKKKIIFLRYDFIRQMALSFLVNVKPVF